MKRRYLLFTVTVAILCVMVVGIALLTNGLGRSHAVASSVTPHVTTSTSSIGVVVGDTYYGTSGEDVYALNAKTGVRLWHYYTKVPASLLAVAQGMVYFFLSYNGHAYALDAKTGAVAWQSQATFSGGVNTLFVQNGVLYIETATEVSVLSALNASNGTLLWTYVSHSGSVGMAFVLIQGVFYISSSQSSGHSGTSLCAVEASNSSEIWCQDYGDLGGFTAPIVTGNIVAVGYYPYGGSSQILAFNISNGSLVWQRSNVSLLAGAQGTIYAFVDGSNVVEAFKAGHGALIWQNGFGTAIQGGSLVSNGVLYVSNSDNNVYAINTTDGSLLWSYNVGAVAFTFVVVNGVAYISTDSALYALNASTGSPLWVSKIPVNTVNFVSVRLGIVYVGSGYIVHALSIQTGKQLWRH